VIWRPVQVLGLGDDVARVKGNLKLEEQVVSLGAHLLHEGEPVRLLGQDEATTAGGRP